MDAGTCGKNAAAVDNLTFYPEKYIDKNVHIGVIIAFRRWVAHYLNPGNTIVIIFTDRINGENEAIHNLQEQVDDLREINPELRIKGLVTMRQKNKTSLDFEESWNYGWTAFYEYNTFL